MKRSPINRISKKQSKAQRELKRLTMHLLVNRANCQCEVCDNWLNKAIPHHLVKPRSNHHNIWDVIIVCNDCHQRIELKDKDFPYTREEMLELVRRKNEQSEI